MFFHSVQVDLKATYPERYLKSVTLQGGRKQILHKKSYFKDSENFISK